MNEQIKYNDLKYGELYNTTREHTYSNIDEKYARVVVPEGERLLFRSFQPYDHFEQKELALFYWFKQKITICLVVCDRTPILYMKHIEWDKRHEIEPKPVRKIN